MGGDQRVCSAGSGHRIAGGARATCPLKIASGKFHGLMQAPDRAPRGWQGSKPRACWA